MDSVEKYNAYINFYDSMIQVVEKCMLLTCIYWDEDPKPSCSPWKKRGVISIIRHYYSSVCVVSSLTKNHKETLCPSGNCMYTTFIICNRFFQCIKSKRHIPHVNISFAKRIRKGYCASHCSVYIIAFQSGVLYTRDDKICYILRVFFTRKARKTIELHYLTCYDVKKGKPKKRLPSKY